MPVEEYSSLKEVRTIFFKPKLYLTNTFQKYRQPPDRRPLSSRCSLTNYSYPFSLEFSFGKLKYFDRWDFIEETFPCISIQVKLLQYTDHSILFCKLICMRQENSNQLFRSCLSSRSCLWKKSSPISCFKSHKSRKLKKNDECILEKGLYSGCIYFGRNIKNYCCFHHGHGLQSALSFLERVENQYSDL